MIGVPLVLNQNKGPTNSKSLPLETLSNFLRAEFMTIIPLGSKSL